FLLGSGSRTRLASPGPLTFEHGTVTHACADCHGAAPERPAELLLSAVTPHSGAAQNEQCLACHDLGEQAASPHGLPAAQREALTRQARTQPPTVAPLFPGAAKALGLSPAPDGALVCGGCHREHQGQNVDL